MATKNNNDVVKSYSCTVENNSAVFQMELDNGRSLTFNSNQYPENVILELLAYGLKQKLADSIAARATKEWSAEDVEERLTSLHNSMKDGSFTSRTPGQALTSQVEQAKARLDLFQSKSPAEQALMSQLGITEASLRKDLNRLTTKLAKTLSK